MTKHRNSLSLTYRATSDSDYSQKLKAYHHVVHRRPTLGRRWLKSRSVHSRSKSGVQNTTTAPWKCSVNLGIKGEHLLLKFFKGCVSLSGSYLQPMEGKVKGQIPKTLNLFFEQSRHTSLLFIILKGHIFSFWNKKSLKQSVNGWISSKTTRTRVDRGRSTPCILWIIHARLPRSLFSICR